MNIDSFKIRLRETIGEGRNVSSFAKKCEFTEGVLRSYLKGVSLPGLDKLVKIAEVGNISVEWLATGKGEMKPDFYYKAPDGSSFTGEVKSNYPVLSDLEEMLLRIIKEGDETKLAAIRGVLSVYDPGDKE